MTSQGKGVAPDKRRQQQIHQLFAKMYAGELKQTKAAFIELLKAYKNEPWCLYGLAYIAFKEDECDSAINYAERALRKIPDKTHCLILLGDIYASLNQHDKSLYHYQKAEKQGGQSISLCHKMATVYKALDRFNKAMVCYEAILKENSEDNEALVNLGVIHKNLGHFDKALALFNKVNQINSNYAKVHLNISSIKAYKDEFDSHIQQMLELHQRQALQGEAHIDLCFALFQALDSVKAYKKAAKYLVEGNQAFRQLIEYDKQVTEHLFKEIKQTFSASLFNQAKGLGHATEAPIFIVGMPRSGTTLVEQILSSHAKVVGLGERQDITAMAHQYFIFDSFSPHQLKALLKKMASQYLNAVKPLVTKPYFIDKKPLNFMWLGLIKLLFPKATIIHCRRDPLDTCFSNYKTQFKKGRADFSYRLDELGHFYQLYYDLMAYWHQVMPNDIYDIDYARLVSAQKEETQALLKACSLDWDDNCLRFYQTERLVLTPSFYQVRQPLHDSAIGVWQRYQAFLPEDCQLVGINGL